MLIFKLPINSDNDSIVLFHYLDLNLVSQPNNCVNEYLDWTGCLPNDDTSCILDIVWVAAPWLSTAYQCPPVTCQGVELSKSDIRWRSMTKHANVSRLTFIRYSGLFINCLFTDILIILDVRTFAIFWRLYLFVFWPCSLSRHVLYITLG